MTLSALQRREILAFYAFRLLRNSYFHVAINITYFISLGISLGDALFLESVYYVAKCIAEVPTGVIADQYSRRACLVASSLVAALGYFLMFISPTYAHLVLGEILLGVSKSSASGADSSLIYDNLQAEGAKAYYRQIEGRGWSMVNIGYGVASAMGSVLAAYYGLAFPFLLTSLFILASLPCLLILKDRHIRHASSSHFSAITEVITRLRISKPFCFTLLFFTLLFMFVRVGFWALQPALTTLSIPLSLFGPLYCFTLFVSILAGLFIHHLPFAPKLVLSGLVFLCISFATIIAGGVYVGGSVGFLFAMLGFSLHGVLQGIYDPIMKDWIHRFCTSSCRTTALSFGAMLGNLSFSALAPFYGRLMEVKGFSTGLGLTTCFFLSLLVALFLWAFWCDALPKAPILGEEAEEEVSHQQPIMEREA